MINSMKFKSSYLKNNDIKITIIMKQKGYKKSLSSNNTKDIYPRQKEKNVTEQ